VAGPKAQPHVIPYRELRRRLEMFGVAEIKGRGKGSERLFVHTDPATGTRRSYPIKCHSEGADVGLGTLKACLRRFGISNDDFWL
jgi:predicted RNA binding protein YcfA (HicA-like mRNA interferase family)